MKQKVTMTVPEFAQAIVGLYADKEYLDKDKYEYLVHFHGMGMGTTEMDWPSHLYMYPDVEPYMYARSQLDNLFHMCTKEDNDLYHGSDRNSNVSLDEVYRYSAILPLLFTAQDSWVEILQSGYCGFIIFASINGKAFMEVSSAIGTLIPVSQLTVGNKEVFRLLMKHAEEVMYSELVTQYGEDPTDSSLLNISEHAIIYERTVKGTGDL